MMHIYKPRPFIWLLAALLVFVACKKSDDAGPGPAPVTDPLTLAVAKPGDTIVIKGQNFSTVAANNTVKFNGVEATVVSATATEITVVIPANATSGSVTVTVNGVTTEVGSLIVNQPAYYCIKVDTVRGAAEHIVAINPADGKESEIASLGDINVIPNIIYLQATNEIIYFNDSATGLVKINVTTKQTSTVRLAGTGPAVRCNQLITDKSGNLYTFKNDYSDGINNLQALVKIDTKTGVLTPVVSLKTAAFYLQTALYFPATNEIMGGSDLGILSKVNLTTGAVSAIILSNSTYEGYYGYFADKQGSLFAYKMITDPNTYQHTEQVVQINPVTGVQTVFATITEDVYLPTGTICSLPERNELAGIWQYNKLYKFNLGTKSAEVITLTTQPNISYSRMTNN